MNALVEAHRTVRLEALPAPDPELFRASAAAGMSAEAIIENHRHSLTGTPIEAPHHVLLGRVRTPDGTEIRCACGHWMIGLRMTQTETQRWWAEHQSEVSRHRASVMA